MTSLFDLDQNSSDSENDVDYIPEEGKLSDNNITDEESIPSSDDEKLDSSNRKPNKRKRKNKIVKIKESDSVETKEHTSENKKIKADEVWKSFLDEVAETPHKTVEQNSTEKSTSISSDISKMPQATTSEIFEFAGETISVAKDGSVLDIESDEKVSSSFESKSAVEECVPTPSVKRKGLQSVLGSIMNKKQKITTLQKSLIDWKTYKKDEGIEEELEKFNKGKGGFIERQRFLQRSDVKSYEIERDLRFSKVKKS